MDASGLEELKELFEQSLLLPPEQRQGFLDEACRYDAAFRGKLDTLLACYEEDPALFDSLAVAVLSHIQVNEPPGCPGRDPYRLAGRTISHYQIEEKLGGGGMGFVYKAQDTKLKRTVALKFLPPELTRDEEARNRFIHEAQAASALDHPNICTIYEIDETETGQTFIVMAFYQGETLKKKIARSALPLAEALDYAVQIAQGLARAHEVGIVHRDVKPANVMVTDRGRVKLLDFGIAKVRNVALTKTGSTLGTASYMSPEQTRGEDVDHRTDIWALGVVFYEMLVGKRPFKGDYDQAIVYSLLNEDPTPLTQINPDLPPDLEQVVMMCLEKEPDLRCACVSDLLADLEARTHGATQPKSTTLRLALRSTVKRRRPALIGRGAARWRTRDVVLVLGLLVALATFTTLGLMQRWGASPQIESIAVLPCSSRSGEADIDYHCDLLSESLIASLSQIPELIAMSFPIVESYKGSGMSVLAIGRELDVDAVITVEVTKRAGGLDFAVVVTDVRTGAHIYGERYESPTTGIRGLHEDVALDVAENLQLRLSAKEETQFRVYNIYQQALYYWNRRTSESLSRAITLFKEVIREDPRFARAHAGLASSYVLLHYYGGMSPAEAYPQARRAAEEALLLDETLADAHASLGLVKRDFERDWLGAEREFVRAIQLDPGYGSALQWYAELLTLVGRFDDAITRIHEAERVSPLSLTTRAVHGWILMCAGRSEEARIQLEATMEMDPTNFFMTHWFLGQLYVQQRHYDAAVEALEQASRISDGAISRIVADLGSAYALRGDLDSTRVLLARLRDVSNRGRYVSRYEYSVVYAGLGNRDQAIQELEAALEERTWQVVNMDIDPMLSPMRDDPRFSGLVRRMGLPHPRSNS